MMKENEAQYANMMNHPVPPGGGGLYKPGAMPDHGGMPGMAAPFRPKRPQSAFARSPAGPGAGVGGGGSPRTVLPHPSASGGGANFRPRSAGVKSGAAWKRAEQMEALREMCVHLKRTANALSEDNMKVKTRMMTVERELGRREKLLRELVQANRSGHGVTMDLKDRLSEERNLLSIFKRKCAALAKNLEERERAIHALKREPRFTRIVELETELQPWVAEIRRLDALMRAPSVELNSVAYAEVEAHKRRAEVSCRLELEKLEKQRTRILGELRDAESEHQEVMTDFLNKENELKHVDADAQGLAKEFKELVEKLAEHEELRKQIRRLSQEKDDHVARQEATKQQIQQIIRENNRQMTISHLTLKQIQDDESRDWMNDFFLFPQGEAGEQLFSCAELRFWEKLARRMWLLGQEGSLMLSDRLRAADSDSDGVLSVEELAGVLSGPGLSLDPADFSPDPAALEGWGSLLARMLSPGTPGLQPAPQSNPHFDGAADADRAPSIRWLDLLVLFDRLVQDAFVTSTSGRGVRNTRRSSEPLGPSAGGGAEGGGLLPRELLARIRSKAVRRNVFAEDIQESLTKFRSLSDVRKFFAETLGLGEADVERLLEVWEQTGSGGLLLRIPLSEAGLTKNKKDALIRKFAACVQKHKGELAEGFGIWGNPSRLTPEQFRTVCLDVLAHEMTQREVEDLQELYLAPGVEDELIDGKAVLENSTASSG